ncbi:hypothetical protein TURU_099852 [Turdus rufiventris]|nr:hypothetical protein TURU_099852 [Turdus rufiventris]
MYVRVALVCVRNQGQNHILSLLVAQLAVKLKLSSRKVQLFFPLAIPTTDPSPDISYYSACGSVMIGP